MTSGIATTIYTGESPIESQGEATAGMIDALFREVAAERNQRVTTPPPGLGQAFIDGCRRYSRNVNHDHAASQSAHETAGWTSFWASRNNPAGIGVTGQTGVGLTFETVEDGIQAQVAHLLSYAAGVGEWTQDDPRASAMPREWFGSARTLHGLNGKWAVPGPVYGESIAMLSNRLLTMEGGGMPESQVPGFEWIPEKAGEFGYPAGTHGRNGQAIDRLIMHCTIGTDSLAWLVGEHGNSVHFLDHRDGRPRAQMVLLADAAWGAGNREYNLRGVNYEHECSYAEMVDPAYWTHSILERMALNAANIIRACPGIKPDRVHVIGHGQVPNQDHTDPGPVFPWDRFMGLILRELEVKPASPPAELLLPGNPFGEIPIVLGFKAYVENLARARFPADMNAGILSIFGYPVAAEARRTEGGTMQTFERCTLLWTPNTTPPWDIVLALRSG
jgi:hypothetical protein